MISQNHNDDMIAFLKTIFDAVLMISLFFGGVFTLNMPIQSFTNWEYTLAIVGASIAGSLTLIYYRREPSGKEVFFKGGCAAISGLVFGSVLTTYFSVEKTPYIFGTFYLAAMLSMFLIRGLLSVTEQNATGFVITILQNLSGGASRVLPRITPEAVAPETTVKTEITVEKKTDDKTE